MAVTDTWADWSSTAASNSPAGAATPEVDDELRNIKAQVKGNVAIAATQDNQETGTSTTTYVSPGRQQFHLSAAKLWAEFGVAGNLTIGYNITSITDNATGVADVIIDNDFAGAEYSVVGMPRSSQPRFLTISDSGQAAGSIQVVCFNKDGNQTDPSVGYLIAAFGRLIT